MSMCSWYAIRGMLPSFSTGANHAIHIGDDSVRCRSGDYGRKASLAAAGVAPEVMIAGHFGFAALVKSRERTAPLWALMLATVWLDIVFVPLLLLHAESVQPLHPGYGGLIIHADYTHSIVGTILLAALLGLVLLPRWGGRVAVVVAFVAISHWVLDLIVHRADMPILPGNAANLPRLGLGLWDEPRVAAAVELFLVVAGSSLYWRAAKQVSLASGQSVTRAAACAAVIAASGVLVLYLDYRG
jgi:membrane-bound metal-dependent hydrolase YbcI (DUF457 family)